jgi:hypothetical protein
VIRFVPPLLGLLIGLAQLGAWAEESLLFGNPVHFCRNGAFPGGGEYPGPQPTFQLGRVRGPGQLPVPFQGDDDGSPSGGGCPRADNPNCRRPISVRPGDGVLVSKTFNGFACAWHQPPGQMRPGAERVGWLPLDRLTLSAPDPNPPLERWLGRWRAAGEPLILRRGRQPGEIEVDGLAYWPGRLHPNAHSGRLRGRAKPDGHTLLIEDGADPPQARCRARLSLLGSLLVVSDNHRCGGLNVTFDGVYQREGWVHQRQAARIGL